MNLTWLDDVLILLEEGNMTRAAERRNVTQPAFSRRIKSFEDWLGTPVLDRQANRVIISEALAGNEAELVALRARLEDLRGKITNFDPASATVTIAAQHAPIFSTFADIAIEAKSHMPAVRFRLRPGNLRDCVSMFVRQDASILLCYEPETNPRLAFGDDVIRIVWGTDMLIPVVGGKLRFQISADKPVPDDTPAIVYPSNSYIGVALDTEQKRFGTSTFAVNPVCETAFTAGIKEMALRGLGIAWVPFSMCVKEIERGDMLSLAHQLGQIPFDVTLYANLSHADVRPLVDIWSSR